MSLVHTCSVCVYSEDEIVEDAFLIADHWNTRSKMNHINPFKVPVPTRPGDIPLASASHMAKPMQ